MDKPPVTKRIVLITLVLSLIVITVIFISNFFDTRTKIVFCDVGQGDGAYIRVKNKIDIVIDAGPGKKVLNCLGKHMPFFDKEIEIAIITHPQTDHYGGFLPMLERYKINTFVIDSFDTPNSSFKELLQKIKEKKSRISAFFQNDEINLGESRIIFHWPPATNDERRTQNDPNNLSLIFTYEENALPAGLRLRGRSDSRSRQGFRVLFTGDATPKVLNKLLKQQNLKSNILKIPHHGSKNGLTKEFLQLADPELSVISVGRKNAYGHPSKNVIDMFKALKKKYLRTDQEGDIVFKIQSTNVKSFRFWISFEI
ncbi:MAG: MBL fold metallo-hydrolase [Candidatus Roizmanbacteria bacterium]|nr:MAG: MBL fold metallo-hydrolase [Candidatus Roizmanbacteria bacterium]